MKKTNAMIWTIAGILVLIALFTVIYNVYLDRKPAAIPDKNEGNVLAPDFTLKDLDGNEVKLSDYKGKVVFLNFWATWCGYCIQEMPDLEEFDKELRKPEDAVVLAINSKESESRVRDYYENSGLSLKVLLDEDGQVTDTYAPYGISGYPTTFIINKDGSFYTYIPGMTNKATLENIIKKLRSE